MSESLKSAIRLAVLRLLDPLVRWLLEAGMGVGDLVSLIKIAYVRAARDQARAGGAEAGRPNVSRISVVTGLTRVEVTNILTTGAADPVFDRGRQRAERVLAGWWNDPAFQDASGSPAILPLRGGKRSFAALVQRYSGVRFLVGTVLEELLRVKAARRLPDGRVEVLSRSCATVRLDPDGIAAFGEQLGEHCATLLQNLRSPSHARYVRRVLNARLNPRYVPLLVRDLEQQAQAFADAADDVLNDPEHTAGSGRDEEISSLGVALYLFELPADEPALPVERSIHSREARRRPSGRKRPVK